MRYSIYILNGMKLCIFYGTHCQCLVMPDFSVTLDLQSSVILRAERRSVKSIVIRFISRGFRIANPIQLLRRIANPA